MKKFTYLSALAQMAAMIGPNAYNIARDPGKKFPDPTPEPCYDRTKRQIKRSNRTKKKHTVKGLRP